MTGRADVAEVRAALDRLGPFSLLSALGIEHKREGRAARFCCPWHAERTPSMTLAVGPEGSLRAHCFGACGRSWDALALVAEIRGLDTRSRFREVLTEAADLAGVRLDVDRSASHSPQSVGNGPRHAPAPPSYPPDAFDLWAPCTRVDRDADVAAYLAGRALDIAEIARLDLARVLPAAALPRWASCAGKTWHASGHRLVVPAYDATGTVRSVRASRVVDGDSPKRLAPSGHTCSGLVFCNPLAWCLLSNPAGVADDMGEVRVLVAEGEPDFLTFATAPAWRGWAVLGVFSGSWSGDVAAAIPDGARVVVATHNDAAGEKYAAAVRDSLAGCCALERTLTETTD